MSHPSSATPVDRRDPARGVSRRTIIRGAAWSVPVIASAAAAPIAAASCVAGSYANNWSTWNRVSATSGSIVVASSTTGAQPVTITAAVVTDTGVTFPVDQLYATGGTLILHMDNAAYTKGMAVTFTFSSPVTNVAFPIEDLDSALDSSHNWLDAVALAPAPSSYQLISGGSPYLPLTGNGTPADPFRITGDQQTAPVDPSHNTAKVVLNGPLTSFTVYYRNWATAATTANADHQNVYIGTVTFDAICP